MKFTYVFFAMVLIAHVAYAGRILREATEAPSPDNSLTLEDVNKFIDKLYTSLKTEVEKIATKENLDKVQNAVQSAAQAAQKGLEELKSQAEDALKTTS